MAIAAPPEAFVIGPIDILDPLGTGAASTLFKVRRKKDGKFYALKKIDLEEDEEGRFLAQAENEFAVGSSLNHPNLMKVFAIDKSRNFFLKVKSVRLLLEFIDGQPLSKCGKLPISIQLKLLHKAADGLTAMHESGFFHADIKPDNIMVVTGASDAKIIDFGLAWRHGEKRNRVQGTKEFLAPEQVMDKVVNAKTDIFNFGATIHRTVTGKPIPDEIRQARRGHGSSLVGGLLRPMADTNPTTPADLDRLVRQCLSVDPNDRPASMKEVRQALRSIIKAQPPSSMGGRPKG